MNQTVPIKRLPLVQILILTAVLIGFGIGAVANLDLAGKFFVEHGNLVEGIACYEMMTSIESCLEIKDLRLANAWTDLSQAYVHVPRLGEAIAAQQEGIRLRRELLGDMDPSVLTLIANMATYETLNKDYGAAERDLKGVLVLAERSQRSELASKGFILRALLDNYLAQEKFLQAETAARQLVDLDDQLMPVRQYAYGGREKLALVLAKTDRLAEAEPLLRESLSLRARYLGPAAASLVSTHEMLGRVLLKFGRKAEADQQFDQALSLVKQHSGADSEPMLYWKARFERLLAASDPLLDEK